MVDEPIKKIEKMTEDVARKVEGFVTEKAVSEESRLWGALCYIVVLLLPLVVLFTEKKKDKFVAFHAFQSLVLFGATIVFYILIGILGFVLGMISSFLTILLLPLQLAPLVVFLLLAWKAYTGKMYELPLMGAVVTKLSRT